MGDQGLIGPEGPPGNKGTQGMVGEAGDSRDGPNGAKGEDGLKGRKGVLFTFISSSFFNQKNLHTPNQRHSGNSCRRDG